MAKSRIVVVEGKNYLVPRKKYRGARKNFANAEDTWSHIMNNIDDFGRLIEEKEEEEEEEVEEKPKKRRRRKAEKSY
jgi:hypothetical protein